MAELYDVVEVERRWQQRWADEGTYEVANDDPRPHFYALCMYPYPSGAAHMGHVRNYTFGDLIVRYRTMRGYAVLSPMGWYPSYRFHQPDIDRILRDGLRRWPNVTIRTGCAVVETDTDGSVSYQHDGSLQYQTARARFVVGCDGARSILRKKVSKSMLDLDFHERWLVVDVDLYRPMPELGEYALQYCSPRRPATYIRGVGTRRRWELALLPEDSAIEVAEPRMVWDYLSRWITPDDAELERAAVYTFHALVAENWREGSLLIAGDAAHQTPPFMGQGMCAGVRDAANLAWKIAAIVGGADEGLIDTYQSERKANVTAYINTAIELGKLINATNTETRAGLEPRQMRTTKPSLGPCLSLGGDMSGTLAPQLIFANGTRLDTLCGYGHILVCRADAVSTAAKGRLAHMKVSLAASDERSVVDWLAENGVAAVIIRPDRYVLGSVKSNAEIASMLDAFEAKLTP